MMTAERVAAPPAPGRLGAAVPAGELLAYLERLRNWRAARKSELDRIDDATTRARDAETYVEDLKLAWVMWQSVTDRLTQLEKVWDSGRVGAQQREEMSRLIWAAGSVGAGGIGLSLVEAARLSDALTAALRARLSFDPVAADVAARIAATRAGLRRSADQLASSRIVRPSEMPDLDRLSRRLEDLAVRATQGADVTGPFAVVEAEAARAERDLIVREASHRDLGRDYRATLERRRELEAREEALRRLVARVVLAVVPPPKLAVPDVERLGRVPQTREALDSYRARLEKVAAALAQAEQAYTAALAEPDELRARLQGFAAKAAARGLAGRTVVGAAYDAAQEVLSQSPVPVAEARSRLHVYSRLLNEPQESGGGNRS
jgi:hypothetical protein